MIATITLTGCNIQTTYKESANANIENTKELNEDASNKGEKICSSYAPETYSDENTVLRPGIYIDIPTIPEDQEQIPHEVYDKIMLEISAVADYWGHNKIETGIEEVNLGAGFITYIVKYDDTAYYHITAEFNPLKVYTMSNISGYGESIWNEVKRQEYFEKNWDKMTDEEKEAFMNNDD